MRYILRANVRGKGFSLYSCDQGGVPQEQPLDLASSASMAEFIEAQKRIDRLLERDAHRPYFHAALSEDHSLAIYGCRLWVPDEFGRMGISVVHGFHGAPDQVLDLVDHVARLVSPDLMAQVSKTVAQIATGGAELAALISLFDSVVASTPSPRPAPAGRDVVLTAAPIAAIEHDASGAVLAWQGMTLAHYRHAARPWTVLDDVTAGGRIATTSGEKSVRGQRLLLSDYLRMAAFAVDSALVTAAPLRNARPPRPETPSLPTQCAGPQAALPPPVHSSPPEPLFSSSQPSAQRWWTRTPVQMAALAAALVAVIVIALVVLINDGTPGPSAPATGQSPQIAGQSGYRFDMPDGWSQVGSEGIYLRSELRPMGAARDQGLIVIDEQSLTVDSTTHRQQALDEAQAYFSSREIAVTLIQDGAQLTGRGVTHYRQTATKPEPTTDWYVLSESTTQIIVGCQSVGATRVQVQQACATVVGSVTPK